MSTLQETVRSLREAADTVEALYTRPKPYSLKQNLLDHYATCEPVMFTQVDGFTGVPQGDFLMASDAAGHSVMGSEVHELRGSNHALRLQIRDGVPADEAVALLEKMLVSVRMQAEQGGVNAFTFDGDWIPGAACDDGSIPF